MFTKSRLIEICNLLNAGFLKIQDAIVLGLNGYTLNCNDGRLTSITTKEAEKE